MVTIAASPTVSYTIPDEWWQFCELESWKPTTKFYLARELNDNDVALIPISEIQPLIRDLGSNSPFRKYKLIPILFRIQSPHDCYLPPIKVKPLQSAEPYRYALTDGFHRFVASICVGYELIPARIQQ